MKNKKQAYFIQRVLAYIIDIFLVTILASLISMPFINIDKTKELQKEETVIVNKLLENSASLEKVMPEYIEFYYKQARENGMLSLISIFITILYFIVYQTYMNGQTLGKKLLKIRVVSIVGDLTMNQMIFRTLIINNLALDIISFIFMVFASSKMYFYSVGILSLIQSMILFISVILLFKKNGRTIHDMLVHTNVVVGE